MIIGVPKEIKDNENRVALTPAGAYELVQLGHQVVVEANAGIGSGFSDVDYLAAGAQIAADGKEVYAGSDIVIKVKEPLPSEYGYFQNGQILFTYLHLAGADPGLTQALLEKQVAAIAYETIELDDGSLPLLTPMSEIAGKMSIQVGVQFLERPHGGKGVLLGGVPGVEPANVVIIGGGVVGTNAAKIATGMGARVTVVDKSTARLRYLDEIFDGRLNTVMSNSYNISRLVKQADILVGAVLIPGARAPHLVTEVMVKDMTPGAVIVDVAIDQGGCIETVDRVSTHSNPTYEKYGIIHYSVANMPGAVPRTSTLALTNATFPYIMQLANHGWEGAILHNKALAKGLNTAYGKVAYKAVADYFKIPHVKIEELFSSSKLKNIS